MQMQKKTHIGTAVGSLHGKTVIQSKCLTARMVLEACMYTIKCGEYISLFCFIFPTLLCLKSNCKEWKTSIHSDFKRHSFQIQPRSFSDHKLLENSPQAQWYHDLDESSNSGRQRVYRIISNSQRSMTWSDGNNYQNLTTHNILSNRMCSKVPIK